MMSKILAGLLSLVAFTACAQELKCPASQGKNVLTSVDLFDGPPAERADLVPDDSRGTTNLMYASWKVGYLFDSGRKLYVVCSYSGPQPTSEVTLKAEKRVSSCIFRAHGKGHPTELSCK